MLKRLNSSFQRRVFRHLSGKGPSEQAVSPQISGMAAPASVAQIAAPKQYGGFNRRFKHSSSSLGCDMNFTVFFPPAAEQGQKVPVIFYLSGLSCTDENFIQKAGAQKRAAELGVALVAPDTSPRGLNVPGESDNWDFGVGAGFYLNATVSGNRRANRILRYGLVEKWKNWRMYDYVVDELPNLLRSSFGDKLDLGRCSIMGHSMGGHGAITIGLKNADRFRSISAFAPICNPASPQCAWGVKAFNGYLGADAAAWRQYDSCELLRGHTGAKIPLLVDQGTADNFLGASQLLPEALEAAARDSGYPLQLRMQEGYDHSYFFISSFIDEHIEFHAQALAKA